MGGFTKKNYIYFLVFISNRLTFARLFFLDKESRIESVMM